MTAVPAGAPVGSAPSTPVRRFCRRCGAQLRAGARFCPHCGAQLETGVATAAVVASSPVWPQTLITGQAARGREHKSWFARLPALGKLGVIFAGLVVIGGVAQALLPSPPKCTYACVVRTGSVQPTGKSFTNGVVSFYYPPVFSKLQANLGSLATLSLNSSSYPAVVDVWAGHGQQSPSALVQEYAQKLSGALQDITALGPVYGAEIGFVPGQGEFYSAEVVSQNGQQIPIGLGVVAAESGGTWAVTEVQTFCTNAANGQVENCNESLLDTQQQNFGIAPQFFDDILAHWHWGGQ